MQLLTRVETSLLTIELKLQLLTTELKLQLLRLKPVLKTDCVKMDETFMLLHF